MPKLNPERLRQLNLSVQDMATYLRQQKWEQVAHENERFLVFKGPLDDFGNPIPLILTSRDDFADTLLRLAQAIELLANIRNCSLDEILVDIQRIRSKQTNKSITRRAKSFWHVLRERHRALLSRI
ncbi:MAG: hypothetical protein HC890_18765 [Chloroflexaceae bacterium]|nr:hypothetical protein [Chloroflexaceae bacterium]